MGVLWDMKVGAQCGRQLCPHPQDREERDSGVPENSICWWSHSCRGAVDRRTSRLRSCALARAAGGDPREPSALLPISSHHQALDVSHSGKYTCACPHGHYRNTAFHHLHHDCSSVSGWFWQSQLLYSGLLMTDYGKKELHKSCVFVVEAWKQRISNSQSCLGMRELN